MPTTPICPLCRNPIPVDDLNVAKDIAYCRPCQTGHALSDLILESDDEPKVDLQHPPSGIEYRTNTSGATIRSSHFSWSRVLTYLGIALFWNGIVSVFVLVALSGTLHHLGIHAPDWFPAPDMHNKAMGVGMVIFLWLFLTPFILIGSALLLSVASTLAGHTEIRLNASQGSIFVGIGPLDWTRRFDPSAVTEVSIGEYSSFNSSSDSTNQTEIRLQEKNGRIIKFGSLLKDERQYYLAAAIRQTLR